MASVMWRVRGLGAGWPARSGGTRTRTYVLSARLTRSRLREPRVPPPGIPGGNKTTLGARWLQVAIEPVYHRLLESGLATKEYIVSREVWRKQGQRLTLFRQRLTIYCEVEGRC